MWSVVIMFGVVLAFALAYVAYLHLCAKYETDKAPRKPMFVCNVHGTFDKQCALNLGDELMVETQDGRTIKDSLLVCPFCYEDSVAAAKRKAT